jgi:hypothetical protein
MLDLKCMVWASGLRPCGEKDSELELRTVKPHGTQAITVSLATVSEVPVFDTWHL